MDKIPVLYKDDDLAVIAKPPGLIIHRTNISSDRITLVSILREQFGTAVYPAHRLDRATSGLMLIALNRETAGLLGEAFMEGSVSKQYLAVVRGWPEAGKIDRPLAPEKGKPPKEAYTEYTPLGRIELPYPVAPYRTSRYSLLDVSIKTGRRHQIRRHLSGAGYPIIGDTSQGNGDHNRLFREKMNCSRLLLHAWKLSFEHPYTKKTISYQLNPDVHFTDLFPEADQLRN